MSKTYGFTGETKIDDGNYYDQIVALVDIPKWGVKKGDIGGWIGSGITLDENSWISKDSMVRGNISIKDSMIKKSTIHGSGLIADCFIDDSTLEFWTGSFVKTEILEAFIEADKVSTKGCYFNGMVYESSYIVTPNKFVLSALNSNVVHASFVGNIKLYNSTIQRCDLSDTECYKSSLLRASVFDSTIYDCEFEPNGSVGTGERKQVRLSVLYRINGLWSDDKEVINTIGMDSDIDTIAIYTRDVTCIADEEGIEDTPLSVIKFDIPMEDMPFDKFPAEIKSQVFEMLTKEELRKAYEDREQTEHSEELPEQQDCEHGI